MQRVPEAVRAGLGIKGVNKTATPFFNWTVQPFLDSAAVSGQCSRCRFQR